MKTIALAAIVMLLCTPAIAKAHNRGPMPAECESRWQPPWVLHFHITDEIAARRCAPWFAHRKKPASLRRNHRQR